MTTNQELNKIKNKVQTALDLLLQADQMACDLELDHKEASVLLTYFSRATGPVKELIQHLENYKPGIKQKTLADVLKEHAPNNGFCYSNYPYPCMLDEALIYAKNLPAPKWYEVETIQPNEVKIYFDKRHTKKLTVHLYWNH